MKRDDFEEGLRELDQAFELPPAVDARLRARLDGGPRRALWPWALAVSALAAASLLWVFVPRDPSTLGGLTVLTQQRLEAVVAADGVVKIVRGTATLSDASQEAVMQAETGAELTRLTSGAAVRRGVVRFEVAHRTERVAPYSVQVSGGVIEVVGTAFTVAQREGAGEVRLHHGVIRFRAADGRVVTLAPGDSVSWPLPAVAVVPPEPARAVLPTAPSVQRVPAPRVVPPVVSVPEPAPVIEPRPAFSSDAVLAQVASLRSRGSFEEAVNVLTRALVEAPPDATRERLGFELGSILTHQLHDVPRACAQWARYRAEHPAGRYAREVSAAIDELGCELKK